jgi:hypothetical protein
MKSLLASGIFVLCLAVSISLPNQSKALDSISQLTGECGGVFTMVRKHFVAEDGKTVDAMLYINFDTRKLSASVTRVNVPAGFDGLSPSSQVSYTTRPPRVDVGFSISTGPIPKSFKIVTDGGVLTDLLILPVNGGNTVLIQAVDDNIVGMCQKL